MSLPGLAAARPAAPASLLPLALLFAIGGLLGLFTVTLKAALGAGWEPVPLLVWILAGAGLILLAVARLSGQAPRRDRRALAYYLAMGLLSISLPNVLSTAAIVHVGAGFVALGYAFPPLVTYALALLLRIEPPRVARAAGLGIAFAGALLLVAARLSPGDAAPVWILAALAAPVLIGTGNIVRAVAWPKGATPLSLAPGVILAGGALVLAFALATGQPLAPPADASALPLVGAAVLIFATLSPLIFALQALAGPVYAGQIGPLGAVAGAALAAIVFGEALGPAVAAATALILAGAVLVNRAR